MPWHIEKGGGTCGTSQWAVIKDDDGSTAGCHSTKSDAQDQIAALNAQESNGRSRAMTLDRTAPREDLIRMGGLFVRDGAQANGQPTVSVRADESDAAAGRLLFGYAAVFDTWTEINSWEGRFRERIQRGAFKRTLDNNGEYVQVLFNHGMDFQIGDKPLGKPRLMEEQKAGLYTETPMSRTSYNDDLIELLKDGALRGMSFRMSVVKDEWEKLDSDLPERTIKEVRLWEFGPVTFPAYEATTAGVRAHGRDAYKRYLEGRVAEQRERITLVVDGRSIEATVAPHEARAIGLKRGGETTEEPPPDPEPATETTPPATEDGEEQEQEEEQTDPLGDPEGDDERARMEASVEREREYRRQIELDKMNDLLARELETADGRYGHL